MVFQTTLDEVPTKLYADAESVICAQEARQRTDISTCNQKQICQIVLSTMSTDFSRRIKKWRGAMLHKEAADKLGVPIWTYRSWEYARRTPSKLALLEIERRMSK